MVLNLVEFMAGNRTLIKSLEDFEKGINIHWYWRL